MRMPILSLLMTQLQNQDPKELQEWIKRVDLKKLAEIKK